MRLKGNIKRIYRVYYVHRGITDMIDDDIYEFFDSYYNLPEEDEDYWDWFNDLCNAIDDRWEELGRAWEEDYDNDR